MSKSGVTPDHSGRNTQAFGALTSSDAPRKILFIDSGSGQGGSSASLCYFLKYLDRKRFLPVMAYYFFNSGSDTQRLQRVGVPVLFLSSRSPTTLDFVPPLRSGVRLHRLRVVLRFCLRFLFVQLPQLYRLLMFLRREPVALIILNNDIHYHLVGAMAAKISGLPCICRKAGGIGEGRRLKQFLTPWVDLFIAISDATARDQLDGNPTTKRLVTVYAGVDLGLFDLIAVQSDIRRELGIPANRKVVGSIARFHPGKGQKELIQAASVVLRECQNVVFLIVGEEVPPRDGLKRELESMVLGLGLNDNVIFTGWREDIQAVLSITDVFVHCPTTFGEGLGIANLEAMAMGKPTVVSDNGGLPDAVLHEITGLIVPPGDVPQLAAAILRLLKDDDLCRWLGRNARSRVTNEFNAQHNALRMQALFEEVLER